MIGPDDINGVFQRDDGTLWRLVSYAAQPTATWEEVVPSGPRGARQQVGGVVGSPLANEFTRLVPQGTTP